MNQLACSQHVITTDVSSQDRLSRTVAPMTRVLDSLELRRALWQHSSSRVMPTSELAY